MQSEDQKIFARAIDLRESGSLSEAIEMMESLAITRSDSAALFAALGHAYSLAKKSRSAIEYFRKSVGAAPGWEPASLGLFHALWNAELVDEAIAEIRRFLMVSHSEDYVEIVKELHHKWVVEGGEEEPELEYLFQRVSSEPA